MEREDAENKSVLRIRWLDIDGYHRFILKKKYASNFTWFFHELPKQSPLGAPRSIF